MFPVLQCFPNISCDSKFWVIYCKITADNWGNILMLVLSIYLPYAHIFSQMEPLCCYLKGIQLMSTLLFVKFYITSKTKEMSYLIQMPSWENISHLSELLLLSNFNNFSNRAISTILQAAAAHWPFAQKWSKDNCCM